MAHSWARNFGVEIECLTDASWRDIEKKLGSEWAVKGDGSLSYNGVEINSPILRGREGFDELKRGVDALVNDFGATVDMTCGLHIHHDVNDLDKKEIGNVLIAYAICRDQIDKFVLPQRRTDGDGYYGRPTGTKKAVVDSLKRTKNDRGDVSFLDAYTRRYYERYYPSYLNELRQTDKFNFGGIGNAVQLNDEYGTIEIRQHEGTVNYAEIYAWIKFGQQLIHVAKDREWRASPRTCAALLTRVKVSKRAQETLLAKASRKTWDMPFGEAEDW